MVSLHSEQAISEAKANGLFLFRLPYACGRPDPASAISLQDYGQLKLTYVRRTSKHRWLRC